MDLNVVSSAAPSSALCCSPHLSPSRSLCSVPPPCLFRPAHRRSGCLFLRCHSQEHIKCRSFSACKDLRCAVTENALPARQDTYTVGDFMTRKDDLFVVKPSTTVDEALELLVENRITGLPVVDESGKLIGIVSDYDLLALDSISGKGSSNMGLFPEPDSTWKAFKQIQRLLSKTKGRTVGEVMTPSPMVVREMTNLEDAARLLLQTKYRRLPVVDASGKLIGLLTRGNVVGAALKIKRTAEKMREALD